MKRGAQKRTLGSGSIRIISGQWRGRKLPVLDLEGLRPTTDRTKETLFNWLMPYIQDSRCLDAYAGSGSLGIEALSRYAAHVSFIDMDPGAVKQIRQNLATLSVTPAAAEVLAGNTLEQISRLQQQFDIVFIDPPFNKGLLAPTLAAAIDANIIAPDGLVYLEHEAQLATPALPANWQLLKQKSTRQMCYALYQVLLP